MTNKYIFKIQPHWILKKHKLKYLFFIYQIKNNNTLIWQEFVQKMNIILYFLGYILRK